MRISLLFFGLALLAVFAASVSLMASGFDIWTAVWLAWALLFAGIEGVALTNDEKGDTLSEKLRNWSGIKSNGGRSPRSWVIFSALLLFFVWFPIHILTGVI
jgi:hypothetical protein